MKIIAVASGKGGTGKTFISTSLSEVMKRSKLNVTLVDCDAEVPNDQLFIKERFEHEQDIKTFCPAIDTSKCTFCNECADNCHYNAISSIPSLKYIKVNPELCHACKGCLYFCKENAISPSWEVIGKVSVTAGNTFIEARLNEGEHSPVPVIREAINCGMGTGAEFLILDAPPGCSCPFVNTVIYADYVLLVSEPTPFGLNDLKHSISVLRKLKKDFGVIINRTDIGNKEMKKYLTMEKIDIIAEIPYSRDIASDYSHGDMAVTHDRELEKQFTDIMNVLI